MADMLLRGPNKSWGNCSCKLCLKTGLRSEVRRANRKRDDRAWQQDAEAGDYSTEQLQWGDCEEAHDHGNFADYMNIPSGQREPWHGHLTPHGPITLETWERRERFKARLRKIREERLSG